MAPTASRTSRCRTRSCTRSNTSPTSQPTPIEAWTKKDFAEACFERYKTEYRAHCYEGTFDNTSDRDIVKALGYEWTARQYEIFQQIYDRYPHTKLAWDFTAVTDWTAQPAEDAVQPQHTPLPNGTYANPQALKEVCDSVDTFRAAIVAYRNPDTEGANKFNSEWVDEFYELLKNPKSSMDQLNTSWRTLGDDERAFVHQSSTYDPWRADIAQLTV